MLTPSSPSSGGAMTSVWPLGPVTVVPFGSSFFGSCCFALRSACAPSSRACSLPFSSFLSR
ncbi:hypothetical protein PL81_21815 [Streptomyces sp. RSD-27]|nr:hypothetical protein PL81_21815 [Streptomyces sp. RSD-27]